MSEGWKVAAVFFGVVGGAAIIFQLNQGNVATSVFTFLQSAIGDAFTSSGGSTPTPTPTPTAKQQSANASPALTAKNHSMPSQMVA
jgi:hypothetical protein